jgi:hypothetical protein
MHGIAYEALAFFDLFFGQFGIMKEAANITEEGAAATEGEAEPATIAQEGFLQEGAEAPAEGAAAEMPAEGQQLATDAAGAYRDIDRRIKEYSVEIACAANRELNREEEMPVEGGEAAPIEGGEVAPVEGGEVAPVEGGEAAAAAGGQ